MPVVPRIVNDVSYVTDITHESHFAWQVQYLVTLEDESCWSAHCKSRFIYNEDIVVLKVRGESFVNF